MAGSSSSSLWSCLPVTSVLWSQEERALQQQQQPKEQAQQGFLLAGQGPSVLLIGQEEEVSPRLQVFQEATVHSLEWVAKGQVLARGGKSTRLLGVQGGRLEVRGPEVRHRDWLLASLPGPAGLHLITAHNSLLLLEEGRESREVGRPCSGPCILYSGLLLPLPSSSPLVVAGTVQGAVLLWHSDSGQQLHSLQGHDGVILGLAHCAITHALASCSDDRSVCVWGVAGRDLPSLQGWRGAEVSLQHRLYGHLARVHRALFLPSLLYTAGEDGCLALWSLDTGQLVDSGEPCGGAGLWSLCGAGGGVVVGGGDGSVRRAGGAILLVPMEAETTDFFRNSKWSHRLHPSDRP